MGVTHHPVLRSPDFPPAEISRPATARSAPKLFLALRLTYYASACDPAQGCAAGRAYKLFGILALSLSRNPPNRLLQAAGQFSLVEVRVVFIDGAGYALHDLPVEFTLQIAQELRACDEN